MLITFLARTIHAKNKCKILPHRHIVHNRKQHPPQADELLCYYVPMWFKKDITCAQAGINLLYFSANFIH
jgi:hypothetical protein